MDALAVRYELPADANAKSRQWLCTWMTPRTTIKGTKDGSMTAVAMAGCQMNEIVGRQ